MGSTSETGHAKNVSNFNILATCTKAIGTTYNPAVPEQTQPQIEKQLTEAQEVLTALAKTAANYSVMVDEREALYEPLPKLVTRALNMFRSSVKNKAETDTAQRLADLIRGVAAKAKPKKEDKENAVSNNEENKNEKSISTSRQSYDSMYENFEKFIEVLDVNKTYKPNETELSVTGLRSLLAQMKISNDSATSIERAYADARGLRNQVLYAKGSGIVDTAMAIKQYVKSTVKPEHAQYKLISKLEFKRVKA